MIKLEIQAETIPELVKQVKELAKNFNVENVSRTTIMQPKVETREAVEVTTKASIKEEPKKEEPKKETDAEKFVKEIKAAAPSTDDCRLAYIDATHAGVTKAQIKAILNELNVEKITAIPEEKRQTFIDKVKALTKE